MVAFQGKNSFKMNSVINAEKVLIKELLLVTNLFQHVLYDFRTAH